MRVVRVLNGAKPQGQEPFVRIIVEQHQLTGETSVKCTAPLPPLDLMTLLARGLCAVLLGVVEQATNKSLVLPPSGKDQP
jgi:hypothetical protein